jgi:hypothetical protein
MHIGPNQVTTHEPTILPSDAEETNALRLHGRPLLIRGSVLSNFSEVLSGTWADMPGIQPKRDLMRLIQCQIKRHGAALST